MLVSDQKPSRRLHRGLGPAGFGRFFFFRRERRLSVEEKKTERTRKLVGSGKKHANDLVINVFLYFGEFFVCAFVLFFTFYTK